MSIEAMKQALEALETLNSGDSYKTHNAATALRQAIEEAEKQEPIKRSFSADVGRLLKDGKGFYDDGTPIDYKDIQLKIKGVGEDTFECVEVRIPRPPKREWVGLHEHELQVLDFNDPERGKLARAVEAKLKEKNT